MKNSFVMAAALLVALLIAAFVNHQMTRAPHARLQLESLFYEQTDLLIKVPDPENTIVEIYDGYVLIKRPDGLTTMLPTARIHAIDGHPI